jgi:hypothetical protein
MASIINASTSGVGGVITTADNSGDLNIQSGGTTKIAVTSAGANIVGTLTVNGVAPASGKVLQVVQGSTATGTSTSSTSFVATNLTATITPTSATSKILVSVSGGDLDNGTTASIQIFATIVRNSTNIGNSSGLSTAFGVSRVIVPNSIQVLDSPATTSATTYTVHIKASSAVAVNFTLSGELATITLMEIAA